MLCRTRSRAHSLELHFLQNRVDPTQSMGWSWPLAGLWEAQVKQSINCLLSPCECLLLWINPMQFFSRQSSQSQMISWQWQRIKAVSKLLGNSNTSKKYRKLKIHDLLYFNGDNHTKKKQTNKKHAGTLEPKDLAGRSASRLYSRTSWSEWRSAWCTLANCSASSPTTVASSWQFVKWHAWHWLLTLTEDELFLGIGYAKVLSWQSEFISWTKLSYQSINMSGFNFNWPNKITLKCDKVPRMARTDLFSPSGWLPSLEEEMIAGAGPDQGKIQTTWTNPNKQNFLYIITRFLANISCERSPQDGVLA